MIQFDEHIFQMGGKKPPTSNLFWFDSIRDLQVVGPEPMENKWSEKTHL